MDKRHWHRRFQLPLWVLTWFTALAAALTNVFTRFEVMGVVESAITYGALLILAMIGLVLLDQRMWNNE